VFIHDLPSVISYLCAAVLLLLVLGFTIRARFSTDLGSALVPALFLNIIWAGVLAWDSRSGWFAAPGHYFLEMARYAGWLLLMWVALPRNSEDPWLQALPRVMVAVFTVLVLAGAAVSAAIDIGLMQQWLSSVQLISLLNISSEALIVIKNMNYL
jgi:hypothetical protein